jgi:hypothetical protein
MNPARSRAMTAIADLRRTAADTVAVCDTIILGHEGEADAAVRALPRRARALIFRAQRCLTALETEGIS